MGPQVGTTGLDEHCTVLFMKCFGREEPARELDFDEGFLSKGASLQLLATAEAGFWSAD